MDHQCISCNMSFKSNKCLQQHLKCKRHTDRLTKQTPLPTFVCDACGKKYCHRQSLHTHKLSCVEVAVVVVPTQNDAKSVQENLQQQIDEIKQAFDKERQEMKAQIAMLLDKHAGSGTTNNNNNNITNSHNIETQQNINININSFGNENTDYIDNKSILASISKVYKSNSS